MRITVGGLARVVFLVVSLPAALAACGAADIGAAQSESTGTGSSADENRNLPPIPEGAIKVGEDRYMVPMGQDQNGCIAYRVFSQKKFVLMVI
jgi:hypothetical protein